MYDFYIYSLFDYCISEDYKLVRNYSLIFELKVVIMFKFFDLEI